MTFSHANEPIRGLDVSVVIPVCNEQDNVLPLAREIHAALEGRHRYETIFVDDGSTDGTAQAVRSARTDGMPEIRLIRHSARSGQSAAVATGAPWVCDRVMSNSTLFESLIAMCNDSEFELSIPTSPPRP
mgnify:CR=1 FL=1